MDNEKRFFGIVCLSKDHYWVTAYLDGETIHVDKSDIVFVEKVSGFPTAKKTEKPNKNKGEFNPAETVIDKLTITATIDDINNVLADINIEEEKEII
jgi:hypothetical protein